MYIMCVILCLFSDLSRRVGALQMSIIIIIIRRRSKRTKKCHNKDENYDNNAMHFKTEKVLQQSASPSLAGCLRVTLTRVGRAAARTHCYRCVQYCRVSKQWCGCQFSGFLTCTRMLMHAIANGGCTDTVRESALKADSGRNIPFRTGGLSIAPGSSVGRCTN